MLVDRVISLKDFTTQYSYLGTERTIKRWIREGYKGFDCCAFKSGKKILIDIDAVERWLENQRLRQKD